MVHEPQSHKYLSETFYGLVAHGDAVRRRSRQLVWQARRVRAAATRTVSDATRAARSAQTERTRTEVLPASAAWNDSDAVASGLTHSRLGAGSEREAAQRSVSVPVAGPDERSSLRASS